MSHCNHDHDHPHNHAHDHNHGHDHTHSHSHGHCHGGAGHSHAPEVTDINKKRVFWVMLMTGAFMIVEAIGGWISGSLALLADAGHMLTDTAALVLAYIAFHMAAKPADTQRSYGYRRFQILAAFANGIALFGISLWIAVEAGHRLLNPTQVDGYGMIAVASAGLVVNIIGFNILSRADQSNLNIRGAALHVLGDLLGSVAAIIAAIIILSTGWTPIDPILSVLVCILILRSAWALIRQSAHILLQGTPENITITQVTQALSGVRGIHDLHDIHVWALTDSHPVITLHIITAPDADQARVLKETSNILKNTFKGAHTTIQIESAGQECPNPCTV